MKSILLWFLFSAALVYAEAVKYEYAEVYISSDKDLSFLSSRGIDIDRSSLGPNGAVLNGKITVYVNEDQFSEIANSGYKTEWKPLIISKAGYRYNEAIGDSMLIWQNRHPSICKRLQIGTSVQGRPMWALKITDSVEVEEAEPEVKLISTMHGDEVTGMEMEMLLIENILKGYAAENDTMRFLVDNTELYIMPLMNPDGMANNSRYNANGYDLNRNFPEGTYYDADSVNAAVLPEIDAIIKWTKEHNFVLSTNYHGGALVANYLYDKDFGVPNYSYAACPDDPHVTWMAYNYSVRNSPMFNGSFTDGITNGCVWYTIDGGMQDWNYRYHNCLDITLEISNTKWPAYSAIPGFWADNREAMMWYLSAAHKGIFGTVTDSVTGEPLNATIEIAGISKQYFTDPDIGDYYRILKSGTYTMTVSAENYNPQTIENIIVTDETGAFREATEVNVKLVSCLGIGGEDMRIPLKITLEQNYPNPFNPSTTIDFTVAEDSNLKLIITDCSGKVVNSGESRFYNKGRHTMEFKAEGLSSGIYNYSFKKDDGSVVSRKMLILK
ncbi:MAG TPA: DUF2817 domain-containing protein [Clostridiales bacterium]|nr:DUF2817 domain-containing protein [Clostridiales bacterium]HQP69739.1 DUF2817 domain-containing protein [Clostridiales bacterium]